MNICYNSSSSKQKEEFFMAKKENRGKITFSCTVCGEKGYRSQKQKDTERLTRNKYCSKCQKHTPHKEDK